MIFWDTPTPYLNQDVANHILYKLFSLKWMEDSLFSPQFTLYENNNLISLTIDKSCVVSRDIEIFRFVNMSSLWLNLAESSRTLKGLINGGQRRLRPVVEHGEYSFGAKCITAVRDIVIYFTCFVTNSCYFSAFCKDI